MKVLIILILLSSLSSFAKVIAKSEVKNQFIRAMSQTVIGDFDLYDLVENSVEVSLPDGVFGWMSEMAISTLDDGDVYEIHATFTKDGDTYHYNELFVVLSKGLNTENKFEYEMLSHSFTDKVFFSVEKGEYIQFNSDFYHHWDRIESYY